MLSSYNSDMIIHRVFVLAGIGIHLLSGISQNELSVSLILAVLVSLVGIPHGAMDPVIAKDVGLMNTVKSSVLFLTAYLLIAVFVLVLFRMMPTPILVIFLLLSLYHFSVDWCVGNYRMQQMAMASLVITCPTLFHFDDVVTIFSILIPSVDASRLAYGIIVFFIIILPVLLSEFYSTNTEKKILSISVIVFSILLNPLLFFTVYFCFYHSPKHMVEIFSASQQSKIQVVLITLLIMICTLALAVLAFHHLSYDTISDSLTATVYLGLLSLTFPHMILIEYANYQRMKNTSSISADHLNG